MAINHLDLWEEHPLESVFAKGLEQENAQIFQETKKEVLCQWNRGNQVKRIKRTE